METTSTIWTKIYGVLEKISFIAVLATVALLPILFLSSSYFPSQNVRALLFVGTAALCVFTLLFKFILDGKVSIQKSPATWIFVLLALFGVVSSYFSTSFGSSFIGDGAEIGTSSFLLAFAGILLAMPAFFAEKKRIFYFYFAFLFSFAALAIFQILRLVAGPSFLSFGVFTSASSSIAGNWNDVAIIAAVAALFSAIGLEIKAFGGILRGILYAVFPIALILLVVVNFSLGWIALAVLALLLSLYSYFFMTPKEGTGRSIPLFALILLVVSIVFVFAGTAIGGKISSVFNIFQVEAHPLWATTLSIAIPVVKTSPVFGVGPNRFSYVWQLLKPVGVNASPFWATMFVFGVGIVPTAIITMGVVGFALYILFFIFYLWYGVKALKSLRGKSEVSQFVLLTSFAGSLFFWIASVVYVPGLVAFAFTALWTAIFFAALQSEGLLGMTEFSFGQSRAGKYALTAVAVIFMIGSAWIALAYSGKTLAAAYLQRAQYSASVEGNPVTATAYIQKALAFSTSPLLYRSLVSADLGTLNAVISSASSATASSSAALKDKFNTALGNTLDAGKLAITGDPVDFRNWVALGGIYETLVPIGYPNAYENASAAYTRAQALSPVNPEMYLNLARLESENASSTAAKGYISKALGLKNDYVAGIFLLSQIQVAEKDYAGAIKSLIAAANINPNDQAVLYQLGVLTYSTGDYKTAAAALNAAVANNPSFSNARYFLALTYVKLGQKANAISQLQNILKLNPNNADVKAAITALQSAATVPQKTATTTAKIAPKKK